MITTDLTAIIGAGVMGETLLSGLLRSGRAPADLVVCEPRPVRAVELEAKYGVKVVPSTEAAERAQTLVLVVKPQDMAALCAEISPHLSADTLVVSLAAGITTDFLQTRLPTRTAVVRVMPNTPALVDQGMAALSPGATCTEQQLERAEALLRAVGRAIRVPEKYQDAVTAISGSGPAYVFFFIEAMVQAATEMGLSAEQGGHLALATFAGAAALAQQSPLSPAVLREQVTSQGGTTHAAITALQQQGVGPAFVKALHAARERAAELGRTSG